jgi:hypothetical protein
MSTPRQQALAKAVMLAELDRLRRQLAAELKALVYFRARRVIRRAGVFVSLHSKSYDRIIGRSPGGTVCFALINAPARPSGSSLSNKPVSQTVPEIS